MDRQDLRSQLRPRLTRAQTKRRSIVAGTIALQWKMRGGRQPTRCSRPVARRAVRSPHSDGEPRRQRGQQREGDRQHHGHQRQHGCRRLDSITDTAGRHRPATVDTVRRHRRLNGRTVVRRTRRPRQHLRRRSVYNSRDRVVGPDPQRWKPRCGVGGVDRRGAVGFTATRSTRRRSHRHQPEGARALRARVGDDDEVNNAVHLHLHRHVRRLRWDLLRPHENTAFLHHERHHLRPVRRAETVTDCQGADLTISKIATPSFDRLVQMEDRPSRSTRLGRERHRRWHGDLQLHGQGHSRCRNRQQLQGVNGTITVRTRTTGKTSPPMSPMSIHGGTCTVTGGRCRHQGGQVRSRWTTPAPSIQQTRVGHQYRDGEVGQRRRLDAERLGRRQGLTYVR